MTQPLSVALLGTGSAKTSASLLYGAAVQRLHVLCCLQYTSVIPRWCSEVFAPDAKDLAGEAGLDQLLADASISAVLVVLPVDVAPKVTLRCLAAGKHVLQEKPAAPDVATALEARAAASRQEHSSRPFPPVWAIAENYRSERVFGAARTIISSGAVGDIIKLDLVADMPMNEANKYFNSQWRRNTTSCPGSFLMDSSVHFVAALRTLAHAAGFGEAVRVAGTAYSTTTALPPPDALAGYVGFGGGRGATLSISFACALPRFSLTATGTRGMLEVQRGGWAAGRGEYRLLHQAAGEPVKDERLGFSGLEDELAAFVAQVQGSSDGDEAYRISLAEGMRDLAVVEALLKSSAGGGGVVDITCIPA